MINIQNLKSKLIDEIDLSFWTLTYLQAFNEEGNVEKNGEKGDRDDVERDVSDVGRRSG